MRNRTLSNNESLAVPAYISGVISCFALNEQKQLNFVCSGRLFCLTNIIFECVLHNSLLISYRLVTVKIKASHFIVPIIDCGISTVLIYINTWQNEVIHKYLTEWSHSLWIKIVWISPCEFLYWFCSDKITYIAKLKFFLLKVLIRYDFTGNFNKKLCESKNFHLIQTSGRVALSNYSLLCFLFPHCVLNIVCRFS